MAINQAEELEKFLQGVMTDNFPALDQAQRDRSVQEFIEMLGRLAEVFESVDPTPARYAAMLFFYQKLGIEKMKDAEAARFIVVMVEAAGNFGRRVH